MNEMRKPSGAGCHFSEVDNVSSQLFDRLSGDDHLTAEPVVVPEPVMPEGPFSHVDNVSSGIFDRMEVIEHPDQTNSVPDNTVPLFGQEAAGLDDSVHRDRPKSNPNAADVTYKAAQRRSQLPDSAFPLEGAPLQVNEDLMLSSIRELMVEQKRDFNKKAFPDLEPVAPATAKPGETDEAALCDHVEEYEAVEDSKFKAALVKFVKTDTVLALCLSIWAALLLMIFIEPELSQALAFISLLLLGIFRLIQPNRKTRKVIRRVKRRRDNNALALEDAILTQQA